MIIDCAQDPWELIGQIGDPNFSICDDTCDEIYRHENHPRTLRIRDCEDNQTIDVRGESSEDSFRIATALCTLLNQNYNRPGIRENP
jgi:hypothetical protein